MESASKEYERKIMELEERIKESEDISKNVLSVINENKTLKEYIAKEYSHGRRK